MTEPIDSFLSAWTSAERAGDTETLDTLLTDDFYGVGPLGFILPRPAWLARHRGGLAYESFDLDEVQTRRHGEVAIVTARNNTRGTYQGHPIPEAVRATLVIAGDTGSTRLAAIHMSFIAGTRGAPPLPGAAGPPSGSEHR
ncbi:MAG TPA: nuclear transport factor 2 family protein [Streptosporangiaceae bacterium]|nr:nuclear transport factor 2 family protein [Streptosporangiaceae bacterium]